MLNNRQNPYLVPGAIVLVGVLVAAAIFLTGGGLSGGKTGEVADTAKDAGSLSAFEVAEDIGLKTEDFKRCMDEKRYAADVEADSQDAKSAGGTGTPFSVVINSAGTKYPVFGAFPFDQVKQIIDAALADDQETLKSLEEQFGASVGELVPVSANDHINGDIDAPIKLVLFSDMQCPFCKSFHATLKQVMNEYNGQVAIIYRHLPLDQIHSNARPLAEGSE